MTTRANRVSSPLARFRHRTSIQPLPAAKKFATQALVACWTRYNRGCFLFVSHFGRPFQIADAFFV